MYVRRPPLKFASLSTLKNSKIKIENFAAKHAIYVFFGEYLRGKSFLGSETTPNQLSVPVNGGIYLGSRP